MRDDILVLGKGFIGSRLVEELGCVCCNDRINSYEDADNIIKKFKPGVVINCIGHSGSNVDECEKDINKTLSANTFIPIILAEAALRNNVRFVHIGSGCIYHYDYAKDKPVDELKEPDFFELFYSRTKIYSDKAIASLSNKYPMLIARIRVPLDNRPHPKNVLTKLINYKKIIDLPNSVTYIPDFIKALEHLIKINAKGIYNIANTSGLRYPDLMVVYKKYMPDFKYEVVDYKKINLVRTNLILSTEKLKRSGFPVRDIKEVLEECVQGYLKYSSQVQPAL